VEARKVLQNFVARREAMLAELEQLVELETPSGDAEALARFSARYSEALAACGFECTEHPGAHGPNLFAERSGDGPAIVLVGHADTVWPRGTVEERRPLVRGGKLYGPGAYDMKAGLTLILALARFLAEERWPLRRRLAVLVAADEERGSETAHPLMDALLPRDAAVLVVEPPCPDGSLKIQRKGVGIYSVRVSGREAHAGVEPERGASAIDELARLVLELHGWTDATRGVRVNVGTISGGTATNVIPGSARCGVDVRFDSPADGEDLDRKIRSLRARHPETRVEVSGGVRFPPLVPTPRSLALCEIARGAARSIDLEIGLGRSGGGSDGSYLAARGLAVVDGLGVEGGGAHAADEHIVVERLAPRAALLALTVLALDRVAG
jgi:glutamate carboxypeptidase